LDAHLEMTFGTTQSASRTITIHSPFLDLDDTTVRNSMLSMISSNIIAGSSGPISYPRGAALVQVAIKPIPLA